MKPHVGEYYYFSKVVRAAGAIKRHNGEFFILRNMEFLEGECVGESTFVYHFKGTIGNTTYYFRVGKYGEDRLKFHFKPPSQ